MLVWKATFPKLAQGGVFLLPLYVLAYQVNPGAGVWASVVRLVS